MRPPCRQARFFVITRTYQPQKGYLPHLEQSCRAIMQQCAIGHRWAGNSPIETGFGKPLYLPGGCPGLSVSEWSRERDSARSRRVLLCAENTHYYAPKLWRNSLHNSFGASLRDRGKVDLWRAFLLSVTRRFFVTDPEEITRRSNFVYCICPIHFKFNFSWSYPLALSINIWIITP